MQYTIDIDPIILQKAQLYAQEKGIDFNKYVEKQLTPSRAQGSKKTLVGLLGVIVGILALFVFVASLLPLLGEIAFVGGVVVILLSGVGLYFAFIYGLAKGILILSLLASVAATGISIKKFIDYNQNNTSENHHSESSHGHWWGDDD